MGLLTPSGIASDKTASVFFKGVATEGRLKALYDFENKKVFFPAVHASFKFCVFVASPSPLGVDSKCAFYLHSVDELNDRERCFPLSSADFARVNPNTGTAPIFRSRRDANLTARIYANAPVLVDRSSGTEVKAWPVKYLRMFDMANDSGLFHTRQEVEERHGGWPIERGRMQSGAGVWYPLYQGRSIEAYDHRFAGVAFNSDNIRRGYVSIPTGEASKNNPSFSIEFQYFVLETNIEQYRPIQYLMSYRRSTATTNARTMVSAITPISAYGDSLFLLVPADGKTGPTTGAWMSLLQATFMSITFDFVSRSKLQGQNFSWYILEQLPVIPPERFDQVRFGKKSAAEIIKPAVLELTYTAHDMAPFARDMGYVDADGNVLPPFAWDEDRRLRLRAKLDAVFFHLYGITDRDDVRYIYSTFPIVERQETEAHGRYLSRDLCLAYINALTAGQADAEPVV